MNLSNNRLGGNIPPELGNLAGLKGMTLTRNQLNRSPFQRELGDLASLQSLRLSANMLSGAIPSELGNLGSLTALILSNNGLNGSIPPELGNLSSLATLSISDNELTGAIPPVAGPVDTAEQVRFHQQPVERGDTFGTGQPLQPGLCCIFLGTG